jgi:hypothetical protein
MTVYDDKGRPHNDVGTGAASFWVRPTNVYAGCSCPPWRYNPRHPKPTNPDCTQHGTATND